MSFLPDEHKEPKAKSNYTMPMDEGALKLRVMSSAVVGFITWGENEEGQRRPTRYHVGKEPPFGPDGKDPKYFIAFIVWNYIEERLQIMELTQKTIRTDLEALVNNEVWGDPKTYDIVVTRKGTKLDDTKYSVTPNPHTSCPVEAAKALEENPINLSALFSGADPFTQEK